MEAITSRPLLLHAVGKQIQHAGHKIIQVCSNHAKFKKIELALSAISDFFKTLKRRHWIEEINYEIILVKIHQSILSFDEFIGLLRWLCTNDINNNKSYIKQILSKIHYRENQTHPLQL